MATLFMLCGLPGAGKTTLAKRLERAGARCFVLDELVAAASGEKSEDDLSQQVAERAWEGIGEALRAGRDVVLDWGFDSRQERDETRARASALGAGVRLIFLDLPKSELSRRLASRPWPRVTDAELDLWSAQFEAPAADEVFERMEI
jgi:predicted kinase